MTVPVSRNVNTKELKMIRTANGLPIPIVILNYKSYSFLKLSIQKFGFAIKIQIQGKIRCTSIINMKSNIKLYFKNLKNAFADFIYAEDKTVCKVPFNCIRHQPHLTHVIKKSLESIIITCNYHYYYSIN